MLITIYTSGMGVLTSVRGLLTPLVGRSASAAAQNLNILIYEHGQGE